MSAEHAKLLMDTVSSEGFWVTVGGVGLEIAMRRFPTRKPASWFYVLSRGCTLLSFGLQSVAQWADAVLGQKTRQGETQEKPPK